MKTNTAIGYYSFVGGCIFTMFATFGYRVWAGERVVKANTVNVSTQTPFQDYLYDQFVREIGGLKYGQMQSDAIHKNMRENLQSYEKVLSNPRRIKVTRLQDGTDCEVVTVFSADAKQTITETSGIISFWLNADGSIRDVSPY